MPVTPFRRTINAALLKKSMAEALPDDCQAVDKWEALQLLTKARFAFGLSHRDLTVLQVLLSFRPGSMLVDNLVVFPSNASICERLNGMPNSTMRRHLAKLVDKGMIVRRDSPNGKRYRRRHGDSHVAYGFDLSPLVRRFTEIASAASAAEEAEIHRKQLRDTATVMLRDLVGIVSLSPLCTSTQSRIGDLYKRMRRKLTTDALNDLVAEIQELLAQISVPEDTSETKKMSTKDSQNEHHYQNTYTDKQKGKGLTIPVQDVIETCPEFVSFCYEPIKNWFDFTEMAERLYPTLGLNQSDWNFAHQNLSKEALSLEIAMMFETFDEFKNPSAWLKHISRRGGNHVVDRYRGLRQRQFTAVNSTLDNGKEHIA